MAWWRTHNALWTLCMDLEHNRKLANAKPANLPVGVDFLASPADVKVSYPSPDLSAEYAYLFPSPHIKVKFNSTRTLHPWLSFGGGYADFSPAATKNGNVNVKGRGDSDTLEFGGGVDTRPLIQFKGVPLLKKLADWWKIRGAGFLLWPTPLRRRNPWEPSRTTSPLLGDS